MTRKVLIVTNLPFWSRQNGAAERIAALIEHLVAIGIDLRVYSNTTSHEIPQTQISAPVTSFGDLARDHVIVLKKVCRALGWLKEAWSRLTLQVTRSVPQDAQTWRRAVSECARHGFRRQVREWRPDVIIIEYMWQAGLVVGLTAADRARCRLVLDTHDVMHERCREFVERGEPIDYWADEEEERDALALFDLVLAIQKEDARKLQNLLPSANIIVVPHAQQVVASPGEPGDTSTVLFVGSNNSPNVAGFRAFLREAWPKLLARFPELHLEVVGSIDKRRADLPAADRVHYSGFVDDLDQVYNEARIVVAPLTFGTGLKIKVVDALCHAKPLVTTPIGGEGLEDGWQSAFLVGDGWSEFVGHCTALLSSEDRCISLADAAHQYARSHFSPQAAYSALGAYLQSDK